MSNYTIVDSFRLQEGEILKDDFVYRIDLIESKLGNIPTYEEERISTVKERMRKYFLDLNITVDENYNITSSGWENTGTGENSDGTQANIGVYGGKYAW